MDPIGLAGGLNTYTYALNPLSYIDSLGLSNCGATGSNKEVLYHNTDEKGLNGILESQKLRPSLKANNPKDARYGNGQYLSDILPGTKTNAQLSHDFLGIPFQGKKFENYVAVDVTGLNVTKGRDGVFVISNETPLDISGRIIGFGKNQP
ncbi:HYD1 signature containing ADP-ribosyltransferase family protein [Kosakonia sp. AX9b]